MNIKELAEQAGLGATSNDVWYPLPIGLIHLERFAELVAAAEREACARLCEQLLAESESAYEETEFEKQLRLLSLKLVEIPTKNIAAAIRARGDKHD